MVSKLRRIQAQNVWQNMTNCFNPATVRIVFAFIFAIAFMSAGCANSDASMESDRSLYAVESLIGIVEKIDKSAGEDFGDLLADLEAMSKLSDIAAPDRKIVLAVRPEFEGVSDVSNFPVLLLWSTQLPPGAIEVQIKNSESLQSRFSLGSSVLVEDRHANGGGMHTALLYLTSSGLDLPWEFGGQKISRDASVIRFVPLTSPDHVCMKGPVGSDCAEILASSLLFDVISSDFLFELE